MSYQNYVIAAYLVFVVVLLWDFVAPRIQVRQQLRAVKLRTARHSARPVADNTQHTPHHPGESHDPF